mmetsp:Transcript_8138/g.26696  ORF Transcript_8138/g.26696 Transcript_8138/m.26696 type:complete len:269 (-) Transcript_8138:113-919(-)
MDEEYRLDGSPLPGLRLRNVPRFGHRTDVRRVLGSSAVLDAAHAGGAVVRSQRAVGLRGRLRRFQARNRTVPRAHEPDPALGPAAALVHAPRPDDYLWRHSAVRRRLGGIVFHHERHLAPPGLLHLRIPLPRHDDPRRDVCGDYHPPLLLPAVQRGLPLVVALVPHQRVHGPLRLSLLCVLLFQAGNELCADVLPLFRVHVNHLPRPLPRHGHGGLLLRALVQLGHLLLDKGRLNGRRQRRRRRSVRRPAPRCRRRRDDMHRGGSRAA